MKICPICGSSYEDSVDFCFQDGAPLDLAEDSDPSKDDSSSAADSGPNLEEAYLSLLDPPQLGRSGPARGDEPHDAYRRQR